MTVKELYDRNMAKLKVVDFKSGNVLAFPFDPDQHKDLCNVTVDFVFVDLDVHGRNVMKTYEPIQCCYV